MSYPVKEGFLDIALNTPKKYRVLPYMWVSVKCSWPLLDLKTFRNLRNMFKAHFFFSEQGIFSIKSDVSADLIIFG